ncbi:bifunctional glycosyltransferase family 2 protein/CDP-glycerol:glycerophosphate glycerophosphotransferase [Streptomyces sp. MUM 136J]|uniref:bifunctional glycosyltransferase/CDP-glycerol:glycerophosphate glycerophosphotransferase n=1 Tax=Streptomyces sp. MUM 136J TaxID=2791992 RepID=UPI001F034E4A|nr:bifunctional glycosyltransferase family 2 protein/CDP-glycerol:glycerophosphate glycerophosphotransferase [Streptomyces sp. MUM 136J]MCH0572498.1 bifunctional glycosyltransferase family 2 protein/CDP-glycerol:glycerophosphate glycerophosphotransferase [Streptomyces sp. MUM 136J]
MPRFSVIVPAHQAQAYLPGCLESVLSQSYDDIEVIAVDDGSPDACGALIDECAARDPRVKAVHLPERAGPGGARTAGAARAGGDYLLFLDADDTLTPHALRAIADRLKETGDPDVLVHGSEWVRRDGRVESGTAPLRLTEQGPAPFRLEDRPGLLRGPGAARDTVCRREFAEREGLSFPAGRHAETAWTCPLLMAAESIATLDRVCVHHRRHRPGSAPGPLGRGDFDVFAQYDRVFAFIGQRPELAVWRPVLFRRMVDHVSALFTGPGRLPRGTHAEFLLLARAHYRRHRTPGTPVPLASRLRHTLVRFGLHRTFRLLRLGTAVHARLGKAATRTARTVRAGLLRLHYRVQLRLPLRADLAVFAAHGGRGYGCNPGALEQAFRTFAPHIRTAVVADPAHHHTVPPGPRRLTPGTAAYWTALARSAYLVHNADPADNTGPDRRLVKRRGQVVVQTQQGTPLKHMGLDLLERPAAAGGTGVDELLARVGTWDYVLSANRHATLTWERVHPGRYTTLEYGQPRNDAFQTATAQDVARLRACLGVPEGSVAILYAPTYRDYRRTQRPHLDLERLVHSLGPRFVVLARAHHRQGGPLAPAAERIIDVSGHPGVEELCLASDALVTDYSSIMFDYANLDRPIVVYADDWEVYRETRGVYFGLRSFPPGAVARSEDELIDIFATGHWRGSRSAQLRARFRERFCPWDDGRAAERVVRRVVLGQTEPLPVVPPGERRPVPSAASSLVRSPLATVPQPAGSPTVTESH